MRKISVTSAPGNIFILFLMLSSVCTFAQTNTPASAEKWAFKNGDRVVFLGNSLFENDFQYGYLELALTTRFPATDLTFRNLGWSGDNVFGDARSTYTNPPTAYQHLMQQLASSQPTVVFIGYGGVEAQEGQAGLARFKNGLNNLISKIDSLGARVILLSPVPVMSPDSAVQVSSRNADLTLYGSAIAQIASDRGKTFIDIFKPIQEISKKENIIENGVHLNEAGYYHLARILEKEMGLLPQNTSVEISLSKETAEAKSPAKILASGKDVSALKFTTDENYLPLPVPDGLNEPAQVVKITGLKKGFYTLMADEFEVSTASAKNWSEGVEISHGPSFVQAAEVREMILKKNELHFFQYRPINETYIIGFRSYEQGKHVKDLEDQNILIKFLEGQIELKRMPKARVYTLKAVE
jgi:lysophospholipase L1-like esterase